uniref:Uncharacterized protein n=1 Tax=Cucumis sativus TaxID=3659 RepID=A0A0A0LLM6_CUCSA
MGRSPCCEKAHTNKGAWTKEEDERLISYIRAHGEGCWRSLPKAAGLLRCGKSCRLRWINYLRPDLKRGNFTEEEDELIIKLHSLLGNKRKLLNRGIDPVTHRPINETSQEQVASTTISFTATDVKVKVEEDKSMVVEEFQDLEREDFPIEERCPDLNLELRISPPYQSHPEKIVGPKNLCFACSLGLQNSKDCSCKIGCSIGTSTGNNNKVGYDFLGIKNGILDYRSLEMK